MGIFIDILFYAIIIFVVADIMLLAIVKIIDKRDDIIDFYKEIILKIKNSYECFRQYFRKKSNEVNDDSGAVHNSTELYDSSSEWED